MSDNEIIKALECCSIDDHIGVCTDCPFTDICDEDTQALQKYALDLIKRQQAEIERLNKEVDRLSQCVMYHDGYIVDAKTEAIEEFVKRFEKKIKDVKFTIGQTWEIKCALKQTLEEMTEQSTKIEHNSLCETESYEVKE